MFLYILNAVPFWVISCAIIGLVVGFSLLSYWSIEYFFPKLSKDMAGNLLISSLIQIIAIFYSILLGFIIIMHWEDFNKAKKNVDIEASAFANILRDSYVFPPEIKQKINAAIGNYVLTVRNDEWDKLRMAQSSELTASAIIRVFDVIQSYEPQSNKEKIFYSEIVDQLDQGLDSRRSRLASAKNTLPVSAVVMLIIGCLMITLLTSSLGSVKNKTYHAIVNGSLGGFLAFCLTLIIEFTHPFAGTLTIDAAPFSQGILAQFH